MNLKEVFELMDKFDSSSLGEMEVKIGDGSLMLKKPVVVTAQAPFPAQNVQYQAPQAGHQAYAAAPPAQKEGIEIITAPIVGTFYRGAAPDTPPFVEIGTRLDEGATICILEAMKVMNRLEADFKMEIVSILVENGQMVEYGTPLFEVKHL